MSSKKIHARPCAALLASFVISLPAAGATVSSTFDTGDDGWRFVDVPGQAGGPNFTTILSGPSIPIHSASGGNPGGFISAQDPSDQTFFFDAPAKFLGNQSAAYGGSLRFDVKTSPAIPEWTGDPDVLLISGSAVLVFDFADNPGTAFVTRTVGLSEGLWRVGGLNGAFATQSELLGVLGNLTALRIRGEYVSSVVGDPSTFELASLDNVVLTPVPEPKIALLMSLGVVAIGYAFSRRPKRSVER